MELRDLIGKDRVKQALDKLSTVPEAQAGDIASDIVQLKARFAAYNRNSTMGLLDFATGRVEKAQIVNSLLAIISSLEVDSPTLPPAQGKSVNINVSVNPSAPSAAIDRTTILFLASNPTNTGQLRLGEEHREVEQSLRESGMREKFALTERFAVKARSLYNALLDERPQIVHFSGHGEMMKSNPSLSASGSEEGFRSLVFDVEEQQNMDGYTGGIVVEDNEGKARLVKAETLATLFENISGIRCVLLNACYSESQAQAILEKVPYVIGMNTAVPDKTAILFAAGFYRALGNGRSIPDAYRLGISLVELEGLPGADIPVIKVNEQLLAR